MRCSPRSLKSVLEGEDSEGWSLFHVNVVRTLRAVELNGWLTKRLQAAEVEAVHCAASEQVCFQQALHSCYNNITSHRLQ